MKTLSDLWLECDKKNGSKFRFIDWNHKTRFFTAEKESQDKTHLDGKLDCGTEISFPMNSDFWADYHDGDEFSPRAV